MKGKTKRAKKLLMMGNLLLIPKDREDEVKMLARFGNGYMGMSATLRAFYALDSDERSYVLTELRGYAWECPATPVSNTGVKMQQPSLFGSESDEYTNRETNGVWS